MDRTASSSSPIYLKAFLAVLAFVNPLLIAMHLLNVSQVLYVEEGYPPWFWPILIVLSVLNLILVAVVWRGKKWGVYGLVVYSLLPFVFISRTFGGPWLYLGLLGPVALVLLARPHWKKMR